MIVKAFCAKEFTESVRRAAGVEPLTSPPVTVQTFTPAALAHCDLLYLKLHGLPNEAYWYGDGYTTACAHWQVAITRLNHTVVFAANCFLPESPMLDALFAAGARAVVAGRGPNFGGRSVLFSSDLLGLHFRRALLAGLPAAHALCFAKAALRLSDRKWRKKDALAFELFTP